MPEAFRNISVLLTANNTQLKSSLAQSSLAVRSFDRDVERSNKSLMTTGNLMKAGLAAGAIAAGAGLMYASAKAVEFDKAMRNVNSLTGLAEKDFAALEGRVIAMSKTLPQSATVLAEGLYDIASSGFSGADGMKVLQSAAEGASAGLTTTATSAKAITAVLNAYGRGAEDAADVTDVLFQTVNLGVVSFDELAGSIGDVVGIAAPLGIEIEELGSAIATMTTQGVSGSESTTLLTNLFTKMLKPSEALGTRMKELGYESGEAMLQANGLRGTMDLLRGTVGNSAEAWMELFPDIQAARGALALAANDGENYAAAASKIEDAEARRGATQRTLREQMKSVSAQMTLAKNQMDATAISIGVRLLPVMLALIEGGRDLGSAMKDDVGGIAKALQPTWENLAEIFGDVWEILVELGQAVGPLAGGLAKLAVGGVVITLNALTEVLSVLTGLLADNEGLALTLAIALGITLLGGVSALATKLQVALVLGLVNVIQGMSNMVGAAAGMNTAMLISAAGVTGLAAVIAGAIMGWQGYRDGASQAKDALDEWNQAQSSDSLETQMSGVKEVTQDLVDLEDRLKQLDNRSILSQVFNVKAAGEELGIRRNINDVAEAAQDANAEFSTLYGTVLRYLAQESGMGPSEIAERFASAEGASKSFKDALPMLQKAGVEVGDSFETVKAKLDAYKQSQVVGKDATKDLVEALGTMESGAVDAEAAIDALKSAMDRLIGVFLSSDQAMIAFESSLDELHAVTKDSTASLDANSEAGRANRTAVIDSVSALLEHIEAQARTGEGADELAKRMEVGRQRIMESGKAAGFTTEQMEGLLGQYNLTPEMVDTIVKAVGTETAKSNVQAVQGALDALSDKTVTVAVNYTSMGAKRTVGVGGGLQEKDGGIVSYYADGGMNEEHVAQIAPAGAWRVWAEPETGGEAYIPLAPEKRGRSAKILEEVAGRFGARIEYNAMGSVTKDEVYGDAIDQIKKMAPKMPAASAGMGYQAMMQLLRVAFPGLALISGYRPGAITATGNPSYHGKGRATDLPPRRDVFEWIRAGYAALTKELIFSPMGARQVNNGRPHVYKGVTKAMHYDHIHWAMANGGILAPGSPYNPHVRDQGGPLLPGYTFNGTGAPEMVIPMATGGITKTVPTASKAAAAPRLPASSKALAEQNKLLAENIRLQKAAQAVASARTALKGADTAKERVAAQERLNKALAAEATAHKAVSGARAQRGAKKTEEQLLAEKQLRANKYAWILEHQSLEKQIGYYTHVMKVSKQYSDQWMDAARKREQMMEEMRAKAEQDKLAKRADYSTSLSNRFELGVLDPSRYIAELDKMLVFEKRYSNEWTTILQRRNDIARQVAEERLTIQSNMHELGMISDEKQIESLHRRMGQEKRYSSEWMSLYKEREAIVDAAKNKQEKTLADLNDMLEQEIAAHKRITDAQVDYSKRVADANANAAKATRDLIDSRRDQILSWMALDQKMSSRPSAFALTSDDEAGAREALRAAGLLTQAMDAWTDSQSETKGMSASELILNAREQTALIEEWQDGLQNLRNRGLSDEVIDALGLGDSPEALAQVKAFATATSKEIADLNESVILRTRAANRQLEREQQETFTELGEGLKEIRDRLNEELAEANRDLEAELAGARAELAAIGKSQGLAYGDAIAAGINSSIPAIQAAAAAAQAAMANYTAISNQPPPASAPAQGGGGQYSQPEAKAKMVGGMYVDTATGRPAYYGPNFEPGYADSQKVNGMNSYVMPDGRKAWYYRVPGRTYDSGGILPANSTILATNKTGEDEYVMKRAQLAVFGQIAARQYAGASTGKSVEVTYQVDARGAVEGTAKLITSALEEHTEALLRVVGAGVGT